MPTFLGKFKSAWGLFWGFFCTFCSKLDGPMGTKSHISKVLPALIMTKRISLIVLHWATFRSGCVYLSSPGHLLYVSQPNKTALMHSFMENNTEEIFRLPTSAFCFYFPLFYAEASIYKSTFHVWEKSI